MDTKKIYVHLLVKEIGFYFFERIHHWPDDKDFPPGWQETFDASNKLMKELMQNGSYFHEDGGSVFGDYKKVRNSNGVDGVAKLEFAHRCRLDMTSEEILGIAQEIVGEWDMSPGVERK